MYYSVFPVTGMRLNIINADCVKHILKDNFQNYPNPKLRNMLGEELFGQGIFLANGESWKSQRNMAAPFFRSVKNDPSRIVDTYINHTKILLEILENFYQKKEQVVIQTLFKRLTMDIFCEIGFGVQIGSQQNPVEFSELFDWTLIEMGDRFLNPLRKYFTNRTWKNNIAKMDKFLYHIIQTRKKELESSQSRQILSEKTDLLSRLFLHSDQSDKPLSDKILRDMIVNFLIAGRDTTAVLLTWTFYHLSLYPSVESKVIQEIRNVLNARDPTISDCSELKYLDKVLKETLRLYPPAFPLNIKQAINGDVLPNNVKVAPGQYITINVFALHRLPEYWGDDANEFIPERWEKPLKHNFQFVPFQEGPRICMGMNMAYEEAKVVVAMLLQRGFRFRLVPGEDTSMKVSMILSSKTGLRMNVIKEE